MKTTAHLTWEMGAGYVRKMDAAVQDVSRSGMGLLVTMPLKVGSRIQIVSDNKTRFAIVRRCIPNGTQHLLGVQFEG